MDGGVSGGRLRRLPWLAAVALLSGCATYSHTVGDVEQSVAAGRPAEALSRLDQKGATDRDKVLFLLNRAMLLRLAGEYQASNAAFEEAKALIEGLSALSLSETTTSFLINDATRAYLGEPFEQALLHAYAALNYLDLNDTNAARVEALQVDLRLKALADDDDGPLAQDPFSRYLAGLIYEQRGELSDALISYRKAYEGYLAHQKLYGIQVPASLQADLLRLTDLLGLKDEHKRLRAAFSLKSWPSQPDYRENGELVLLFHNGLAPLKREQITVIYPPLAERMVTVALPGYERRGNGAVSAALVVNGERAETEVVEDINAIAVNTLKAGMPAITARAIARALAKNEVSRRASKENRLAGFVTNLAGVLTERADTRSWIMLPGEIRMARLLAPPGRHTVRVEWRGAHGETIVRDLEVDLEKGRKTFLSYHWVVPPEGRRSR